MADELVELSESFARRLHGADIPVDELVQEFMRFGQRIRSMPRTDDPRIKIVMQIDGAQFMGEGPASVVHGALADWKDTAGFDVPKRLPVTTGFNRPRIGGLVK